MKRRGTAYYRRMRPEVCRLAPPQDGVTPSETCERTSPVHAHQKSAASARMPPNDRSARTRGHRPPESAHGPHASRDAGEQRAPPLSSPSREPATAPRPAPLRGPTSGTGSAVPRLPPTRLPTLASAAARVRPTARPRPRAWPATGHDAELPDLARTEVGDETPTCVPPWCPGALEVFRATWVSGWTGAHRSRASAARGRAPRC
jgi:hypothetical protein